MLRLSLLILLLITTSNAIEVLVTKKAINYNEKISITDIRLVNVNSLKKYCKPLSLKDLEKKTYQAKHYIFAKRVLCLDDVKTYKKKSVVFNFGTFEIEKNGEIIFENDEYIRIKKPNGKIEKIYKDGRVE